MVDVKREGVILEATDREFENQAVLNPGCVQKGDTLHLFYRAVRQGNYSSIGYCRLDGPLEVVERAEEPVLVPEFSYERHGIEDPRVVYIDGIYHLFYTAYDGKNAVAAYATSKNLRDFTKKGILTPKMSYDDAQSLFQQSNIKDRYTLFESYYENVVAKDVLLWEKDAFLFPKRINGKLALIHRILPDIQVIYSNNLEELTLDYWEEYLKNLSSYVVLDAKYWFESRNIGGGCPPIETDKGWLLIYHAVEDSNRGRIYHAGAALLDKKDPTKVLGHLREPLFSPREPWERDGDVSNVVFPTGTAEFDDRLYIYYGAADKRIAAASLDIEELLDELIIDAAPTHIWPEVGNTAGQIFRLAKKKPVNISQLKEALKKEDRLIWMAIGWLAREGKIEVQKSRDGIKLKVQS